MNRGDELGVASVVVVLLEQHLAGFFVERRLGVGRNEQTVRE